MLKREKNRDEKGTAAERERGPPNCHFASGETEAWGGVKWLPQGSQQVQLGLEASFVWLPLCLLEPSRSVSGRAVWGLTSSRVPAAFTLPASQLHRACGRGWPWVSAPKSSTGIPY